jgi:SAM-dependent methyltransferase
MKWKLKALIQKIISHLPLRLSYACYYLIQRKFGGLRVLTPMKQINAGIEICNRIIALEKTLADATFLEVGTGRTLMTPLVFWLAGAKRIISLDKNPYLKKKIIKVNLEFVMKNRIQIESLLGSLLVKGRFEQLSLFLKQKFELRRFLDLCNIDYRAPGDAANTELESDSVDYHTSVVVLEHIPPPDLVRIFTEGFRIVKKQGLFIHRVDYSDHFSHSDNTISSINFLTYSDSQWHRIAGNRYMYMNRLRHDDFIEIINSVAMKLISVNVDIDPQALELVRNNRLILNERFAGKTADILSIRGAWLDFHK